MTISFVEAMRGWLRDGSGQEHPVSFEVLAQRRAGGLFEIRGLLSAPPLARDVPAHGTLEMGIGFIAYHLEFNGADGTPLTLEAMKHPTIFSPLKSMTQMQATVRDAKGATLAEGEMRFALSDLLPFAASWLPGQRDSQKQLEARRRHVERLLLAGGEP